jgi:predicted nucleic acid-binding protein
LRRGLLAGQLTEARALEVLADLRDLTLTIHAHEPFLRRVLALRQNFTAYDACYVALAEALDAEVVTTDERLARAAAPVVGLVVFP